MGANGIYDGIETMLQLETTIDEGGCHLHVRDLVVDTAIEIAKVTDRLDMTVEAEARVRVGIDRPISGVLRAEK